MQHIAWAPLLLPLLCLNAAVVPPPWADPRQNPCAARPGGWQLLYWPQDDTCYRIFQMGHPCTDTMELGPNATGQAECRCPPRTAQSPRDANCHRLFSRGPCGEGQYFAPVPHGVTEKSKGSPRWGTCRDMDPCPGGRVFWPRDGRCYPELTRGPCPRGELLTPAASGPATCRCSPDLPLAPYFSPRTQTCHEHYTRGPCEQRGHLFLPGRECGCSHQLPHYHPETGKCFELGSVAPCPPGQQFLLPEDGVNSTNQRASCQCKPGLVPWAGGDACYRLFTRGPCPKGQILVNVTTCAPVPCRNGRLFFPEGPACYRVGTQGPCPEGQLVLFESVRISVDGVSYRGTCGCEGECEGTVRDARTPYVVCDSVAGFVRVDDRCHRLYARGPCLEGEWLVPSTDSGQRDDDGRRRRKAKCDCRPGYRRIRMEGSDAELCQSPTVVLARFLNQNRNAEVSVA